MVTICRGPAYHSLNAMRRRHGSPSVFELDRFGTPTRAPASWRLTCNSQADLCPAGIQGGRMTDWSVELLGERHVLDALRLAFNSSPLIVSFDESHGRYFLVLPSLSNVTDVNEVRLVAETAVASFAGALFFDGRTLLEPLRVGAVHSVDENGHKQVYVTCSSGIRLTAAAHVAILDSDGNVIPELHKDRRLSHLQLLIAKNENIAKVSRLAQEPDFGTWVGLYRVFEVIFQDAVGTQGLRDWVSRRSTIRFCRSANHPLVAGDAARHGHSDEEPPPQPMTLLEAQAWLKGLLHCWIEHRLAESTEPADAN